VRGIKQQKQQKHQKTTKTTKNNKKTFFGRQIKLNRIKIVFSRQETMNIEHRALLEWCIHRSQEHTISDDDDDRLYLSDISGGFSILMTSQKSIKECTSDAYKAVFKIWNELPEEEKDQFRSLASYELPYTTDNPSSRVSSDD